MERGLVLYLHVNAKLSRLAKRARAKLFLFLKQNSKFVPTLRECHSILNVTFAMFRKQVKVKVAF